MSTLKVGLIGCGRIVRLVHLNILTRLPNVELVALAEVDRLRRESAGSCAPATVCYEDPMQLLERSDIEAVVICLPNALHSEVATAALERGKHVYLEKPLATSMDEAEKVLSVWRGSGAVGMIGFNYRFNPLYQRAREYIQSGKIGEPILARSLFCASEQDLPLWKQSRKSGGGVLL